MVAKKKKMKQNVNKAKIFNFVFPFDLCSTILRNQLKILKVKMYKQKSANKNLATTTGG